ncbi:MAG TPA: hypothetical protein VGG39_00255 [Polyangiaceae bacterium]
MDPIQKKQDDATQTAPVAKPAAPGAAGVESKLKEAQANLMDAEGRLMQSTAGRPSDMMPDRPTANAESRGRTEPAPETRREPAPMANRTREGEVKETTEPKRAPVPSIPPTEHLAENVAGMLCYLLGWVTGVVFLLVDRRPFVRYHAAQSVAVFATLSILLLVCGGFFLGALFPGMAHGLLVLRHILWLVWLVAEVVLMLKAAGGQRPRVGIASQYADRAAHAAK